MVGLRFSHTLLGAVGFGNGGDLPSASRATMAIVGGMAIFFEAPRLAGLRKFPAYTGDQRKEVPLSLSKLSISSAKLALLSSIFYHRRALQPVALNMAIIGLALDLTDLLVLASDPAPLSEKEKSPEALRTYLLNSFYTGCAVGFALAVFDQIRQ